MLNVKTATGFSEPLDLKVKTADGTLADVQQVKTKKSDGTWEMVWVRGGTSPSLTPPGGTDSLILTGNAHDV